MYIPLFLLIFFSGTVISAGIITVDDNSPADFNNIQSAINSAVKGEMIMIPFLKELYHNLPPYYTGLKSGEYYKIPFLFKELNAQPLNEDKFKFLIYKNILSEWKLI